ncbi:DUF1579 family protein [Leptolyngbya sp. 15MV]|nr:DUF1579 family protein [Leptolyngbya sp. 15MV]
MDTHVATRSLGMSRIIPAPPEAVFAAWIEPEKMKPWFGPYGMTAPVAEVEPRVGGRHFVVMRDAAGKEYPALGIIEAIEPNRRLVTRVADEGCGPLKGATGTLTFAPHPLGTLFTVRYDHPTEEMRAAHEAMGFIKGWGETLDKLSAFAATPPADAACPFSQPPSPEHGWLHRMLGDWTWEHEGTMPDGSTARGRGVERVRALGPYWVIGEGEGEMPGGGGMNWKVTLGFNAQTKRFTGTWVGSMMGWLCLYDGALSEDGMTLPLENEGPAFDGNGLARYRDTVILEQDGTRRLTSEVQGKDGAWTQFMTGTFRRKD